VAQGARPVAGRFTRSRRKQQALFEALSAKDFPLKPGAFPEIIDASGAQAKSFTAASKRIVC
jgi:hypothetical protein